MNLGKSLFFSFFFNFIIIIFFGFCFVLFYFTILYWFCHTSTCIRHGCTHVPHPERPLPPLSPYHHSGSSQCTSAKHPVSCIEPGLVIRFTYDIIHVSMPFSQIFPPSPSPTESIRLFYTSVSLLLSSTQGSCYHTEPPGKPMINPKSNNKIQVQHVSPLNKLDTFYIVNKNFKKLSGG